MASKLKKVEGFGDAVFFRGDPRLEDSDMDTWLREVLEKREPEIKRRPYLYGSDAGFCARRNVLLEHNVWLDANINAAGFAYMAIGVALENLLAKSLEESRRLVKQDVRLLEMPELKVSGKIDLIIFDSEDELAIIEVKTCGELPKEPKPTHLAQVQSYCAISGIQRAWLVYLSRNLRPLQPIPTRTFSVDCSEEALTEKLRIAALSRLASDEGVLPPTPASFRKHTECHYCEFRDHFCFGSRPGLAKGGTPLAAPPLPELEPEEVIKLDAKAKLLAKELYLNSDYRRVKTVEFLKGLSGLDVDLEERLEEIYQKELESLVSSGKKP